MQEIRLIKKLPRPSQRLLYRYTLEQDKQALPAVHKTMLGKMGRYGAAVACVVYLAVATLVRRLELSDIFVPIELTHSCHSTSCSCTCVSTQRMRIVRT